MKKISLLVFMLLSITFTAQSQFVLNNDKSVMTIDGTSNLHDWTENVGTMSGNLTATFKDNKLVNISALTTKIVVKSITSGKSAMDKNTYEALKADKFPNILFTLKSTSIVGDKIKLTGTLQVAGVTKTVTINTTYTAKNNEIIVSGSCTINMTNFNVKPPTALLGSITTGENITMKFKLYYTK